MLHQVPSPKSNYFISVDSLNHQLSLVIQVYVRVTLIIEKKL